MKSRLDLATVLYNFGQKGKVKVKTKKIAIDGPAGAGKSTIAKHLARQLGYVYVDTGAMYRAVALYCLRQGIPPTDEKAVCGVLEQIQIDLRYSQGEQQIFLCGENVSGLIRSPEASMGASNVSKFGKVREMLVAMQRKIAEEQNVIMDGRDIATKVIPDADVAIFLTAGVEERARRRFEESREKGMKVSYEEILQDMKIRDKNDSSRAISPLRKAENAIPVDTTGETLEQSIEKISNIVFDRLE